MKIIIDMNLSPSWAGFLQSAGIESAHWSDIGAPDALDSTIMEHARLEGFVILTHDLDFGAILAATSGNAPSVVQIRAGDLSIKAIGDHIMKALRQTSDALASGALVTVDTKKFRLTLLPLGRRDHEIDLVKPA
jgi:predicted nuclease of predicted toxin-antitoxin system